MKLNYCTLFDSGYLTRGLAMYYSLIRQTSDFCLYIVAFDDQCEAILKSLKLKNVVVISLKEFENEDLLRVKKERTRGEYCWTCTSSSILYCIEKYKLKNCTYVDADLYFFDDPSKLIKKVGSNSVLITRHNYAQEYDKSELSGIYCVQFVTFFNSTMGMKILRWWVKQCINWCYNRIEDGRFGDQKYLDDWTTRFKGVYVLDDLGGGMAPWNAVNFRVTRMGDKVRLKHRHTKKTYFLKFYHFHDVRFYEVFNRLLIVSNKNFGYKISKETLKLVYGEYHRETVRALKTVRNIVSDFNKGYEGFWEFLKNYRYKFFQL